jgi:hypothetical protein
MVASTPSPSAPVLHRDKARIVWSALALALVAALVASIAVPMPAPRDPALARVLLVAVAALTVADLVAAYVVTAAIRRKAGTSEGVPREAAPGVQVIIASALALGSGLFACVAHLLTRDPVFLGLVLPPAALLVHWFPSEARWTRIMPAGPGAPGAQPARSMIRE